MSRAEGSPATRAVLDLADFLRDPVQLARLVARVIKNAEIRERARVGLPVGTAVLLEERFRFQELRFRGLTVPETLFDGRARHEATGTQVRPPVDRPG